MGNGPKQKKPGARSKIKKYKRACLTKNRSKDLDQIQDEVIAAKASGDVTLSTLSSVEFDDDLPGGGQFFCWETSRHFPDLKSLTDHKKTREYKRRVKQIKEEKYDPDWAAGLTKEKLPPAHGDKKK
ncbi:hypothetical protein TrVE_jg2130 [Triparma verrucosa]|uniref:Uncharacterized protein n=2 Tax=Triparma TaxID=722752 RepID=A0A9W7EUK9_9STRA|nr:hypothetical protein TrST_g13356 [Triparma strigata]GMH99854.1 hypothetical protein TrVE_jg2130 [Triparma verrucosa]|mmetsp:Transcript_2420/g.4366  ORF Transcript_2420/g.4366 Transcript_2420/m.4366 type:complete len:127 (-) Transcript_2420:65-445(-)